MPRSRLVQNRATLIFGLLLAAGFSYETARSTAALGPLSDLQLIAVVLLTALEVACIGFALRVAFSGAVVKPDGVLVRNFLSSKFFEWEDIEAFAPPAEGDWLRATRLQTKDGREQRITSCADTPIRGDAGSRLSERLNGYLAAARA